MMIFRFAINRFSYLQLLKWLTACYWRALGKGERVKNNPRMLTEMRIGYLPIFIYIYMNILLHVIAWGQLLPSGRCSVSQGEAGGRSRLWAAPASAKQVSSLFFHFSGKPNSRTDYMRKNLAKNIRVSREKIQHWGPVHRWFTCFASHIHIMTHFSPIYLKD